MPMQPGFPSSPSRRVRDFALVVVAGAALCACADEQLSVVIRGTTALTEECAAVKEEGTVQAAGVVDVALKTGYRLGIEVVNQLDASPDEATPNAPGGSTGEGPQPNDVILNLLHLRYRAPQGVDVTFDIPDVTQELVSTIRAGGGTAILSFSLTDTTIAETVVNTQDFADLGLTPEVTAEIWLEGDTVGGRHVRTNEIAYPVAFCQGCMVDSRIEVDPALGPVCPAEGGGTTPAAFLADCCPGQDGCALTCE